MNISGLSGLAALSVALAVAMAAAAYFHLAAKIRAVRSESASASQEMRTRLETLTNDFESCRRRLDEAAQRHAPIAEHAAVPASIHLNRRGQVARLHRRGEAPQRIAAALGISQPEVKLMIKVHDLNQRPQAGANNRANLNLKSSQFFDNASGLNEGEA